MIKFNVTVTDTGIPQLTSTAQIVVNVIAINDNPPHFNETEYHLIVNENAMKGTSIGAVHASDADEGNYLPTNALQVLFFVQLSGFYESWRI